MLSIREDDLSGDATRELLRLHLMGMHANSPPGQVFALDLSGLTAPGVTVWSAWRDESIAGIGALRVIDATLGEVKSMRTHPEHLRRGVAAALLEHIIEAACKHGLKQLSLETGSGEAFEPALALYRRRGFEVGPPFGGYAKSEFNRFLHLDLVNPHPAVPAPPQAGPSPPRPRRA